MRGKELNYNPSDYPPIKIPKHFVELVRNWPKIANYTIDNLGINISLAINDYDKKLNNLAKSSIKSLNDKNIILCNYWRDEKVGILTSEPRGVLRIELSKNHLEKIKSEI